MHSRREKYHLTWYLILEQTKKNRQPLRLHGIANILFDSTQHFTETIGWGLILGFPTILIPGLQHKFGNVTDIDLDLISNEQVSWIGSVNLLFVPLGSIVSGLLVDPLGKRRMMQVTLNNFAMGKR